MTWLSFGVIHRYTYLTTETVLSQAGVISQAVFDVKFVADQSKRVAVGGWSFRFRKPTSPFHWRCLEWTTSSKFIQMSRWLLPYSDNPFKRRLLLDKGRAPDAV